MEESVSEYLLMLSKDQRRDALLKILDNLCADSDDHGTEIKLIVQQWLQSQAAYVKQEPRTEPIVNNNDAGRQRIAKSEPKSPPTPLSSRNQESPATIFVDNSPPSVKREPKCPEPKGSEDSCVTAESEKKPEVIESNANTDSGSDDKSTITRSRRSVSVKNYSERGSKTRDSHDELEPKPCGRRGRSAAVQQSSADQKKDATKSISKFINSDSNDNATVKSSSSTKGLVKSEKGQTRSEVSASIKKEIKLIKEELNDSMDTELNESSPFVKSEHNSVNGDTGASGRKRKFESAGTNAKKEDQANEEPRKRSRAATAEPASSSTTTIATTIEIRKESAGSDDEAAASTTKPGPSSSKMKPGHSRQNLCFTSDDEEKPPMPGSSSAGAAGSSRAGGSDDAGDGTRRSGRNRGPPKHVVKIDLSSDESDEFDEKQVTRKGRGGGRKRQMSSDEEYSEEEEVKKKKSKGKGRKKRVNRYFSDDEDFKVESDGGSEESEAATEPESDHKSSVSASETEEDELDRKERKSKVQKQRQTKERKKREKKDKKSRIQNGGFNNSSDDEDLGKNTARGRHKLLTSEQLEKETVEAARREKERLQRIEERKKIMEELEKERQSQDKGDSEMNKSLNIEENKVVLDMDKKTKETLVEVNPVLCDCLKPHQRDGIKFLYDNTVESVEALKNKDLGHGCILAHSMGLGKTLQIIAYIHTLLANPTVGEHIKTALVVVPVNVIRNWAVEFNKWLFENGLSDFKVYELTQEAKKEGALQRWQRKGGVMIIGHNAYSKFVRAITQKNTRKDHRETYQETLVDPGPDIVVVDEGHFIKNQSTQLNTTLSQIRTRRRIILTGTPLQNNLEEYYTMVSFIKPNLLGTLKEFRNQFSNPIKDGQHQDSTPQQVAIMKRRAHVLFKRLGGCINRKDYTTLAPYLQPKHEYVIKVQLSEAQIQLYQYYLENFARRNSGGGRSSLLVDSNVLRLICAHPHILYFYADRVQERAWLNEEEAESTPSEDSEEDGEARNGLTNGEKDISKLISDPSWFKPHIPEKDKIVIEISYKTALLFEIMNECERIGDKLLVFSQSIDTLNIIEGILEQIHVESEKRKNLGKEPLNELRNTWVFDRDYFLIDGTKGAETRKKSIDAFNDPLNTRARLFLLSTKAGSLGINLVGANRSVIFDSSWNPTHDIQAIFRTYRFGQKKPVYVYRFVSSGTMEERVYERQIIKESLSKRVIDEKQIERHFSKNELQELYRFEPHKENKEEPRTPKDMLLAMLLRSSDTKKFIQGYHEHDSLLENRPEEDLSPAEQRQAWEDYERDRSMTPHERQLMIMQQQHKALQEQREQQMRALLLAQQQHQFLAQQQSQQAAAKPSILQRPGQNNSSVIPNMLELLQKARENGTLGLLLQAYPQIAYFMSDVPPEPRAAKARFDPATASLDEVYDLIKSTVSGKEWSNAELTDRANAILSQSWRNAMSAVGRLNKESSAASREELKRYQAEMNNLKRLMDENEMKANS